MTISPRLPRLLSLSLLAWLGVQWTAAATAEDAAAPGPEPQSERRQGWNLYQPRNLVAWCIVPFDARKRNAEERAEMVKALGLSRVAYDWRDEHVSAFEDEILAYQRHGIEFFAFWSWHPEFAPLVQKHGIHPQFWIMIPNVEGDTDAARTRLAAEQLLPVVRSAAELGCEVGLYNHGGWGGEPENMVAVCAELRTSHQADNVGIVYNFHHGHSHIVNFAESFALMKPYLLCVNINGMNDAEMPKILRVGDGAHDVEMLRIVAESGYDGAIGIIDHRPETDSADTLRENLAGLAEIVEQQSGQ